MCLAASSRSAGPTLPIKLQAASDEMFFASRVAVDQTEQSLPRASPFDVLLFLKLLIYACHHLLARGTWDVTSHVVRCTVDTAGRLLYFPFEGHFAVGAMLAAKNVPV